METGDSGAQGQPWVHVDKCEASVGHVRLESSKQTNKQAGKKDETKSGEY